MDWKLTPHASNEWPGAMRITSCQTLCKAPLQIGRSRKKAKTLLQDYSSPEQGLSLKATLIKTYLLQTVLREFVRNASGFC
jgi:hypothetical protein